MRRFISAEALKLKSFAKSLKTLTLMWRTPSLMKFGRYWGALCVYYASTIHWTMAMGVAFILAERYGSLWVQELEEFYDLTRGGESEPSEEKLDASLPVLIKEASLAKFA